MRFSEFLIIYLACGVPFSIYYFSKNNKKLTLVNISFSLLVLLFWFLYAIDLITKIKPTKDSTEKEISKLQEQICNFIKEHSKNINPMQIHEIVQCYIALALSRKKALQNFELFKISGHPNPAIGVKCIQRRNNQKIGARLMLARKNFFELVSKCNNSEKALKVIQNLVKILNDDKDSAIFLNSLSEPKSVSIVNSNSVFQWETRSFERENLQENSNTALISKAHPKHNIMNYS